MAAPEAYSTADVIAAFMRQVSYCQSRGADLTASIIEGAVRDLENNGPLSALIGPPVNEDPGRAALSLRVAGALHYLVIKERASALQVAYAEGRPIDPEYVRDVLADLALSERDVFRRFLENPPQTNETNRITALLPALAEVANIAAAPIDLYELGASAGLLLAPDRCTIDYGAFCWGNGPLALKSDWRGTAPEAFPAKLNIRHRRGCDRNPIDLTDSDQRDVMRAYFWPEDYERRARLEVAFNVWDEVCPKIDQADALDWLGAQRLPQEGAVSVLFTSVFACYLEDDQRAQLHNLVEDIGARAKPSSPFAFIQFEPGPGLDYRRFLIELTVWPGGERRCVATSHSHAQWVEPVTD